MLNVLLHLLCRICNIQFVGPNHIASCVHKYEHALHWCTDKLPGATEIIYFMILTSDCWAALLFVANICEIYKCVVHAGCSDQSKQRESRPHRIVSINCSRIYRSAAEMPLLYATKWHEFHFGEWMCGGMCLIGLDAFHVGVFSIIIWNCVGSVVMCRINCG